MFGTCSTHGKLGNSYKTFNAKPQGNRIPGRYRCRWEDKIKIDLKESCVSDSTRS